MKDVRRQTTKLKIYVIDVLFIARPDESGLFGK